MRLIVELHDARRALAAYMPAADGTVGIARQFYHTPSMTCALMEQLLKHMLQVVGIHSPAFGS